MNKNYLPFSVLLAAFSLPSYGEIDINGFASIVAGTTVDGDEALYQYHSDVSFDQESLFALQFSSDLDEGLSVVAQIMARGDNDWEPKFEWAYLSYALTDEVQVLAGRQRIPFYMYSDFLDVSYAYNWITPPENVYGIPFSSFNGLGAIYNDNFGDFDGTLHVIYGGTPEDIIINGNTVESNIKNLMGAALTINQDWLTLRSAYFTFDHSMPIFDALANGYRNFGQMEIADEIQVFEDQAQFFEFGIQLDLTELFVIGEYTYSEVDGTFLGETDTFYVSVGRNFDDFTLHATYGEKKIEQGVITQGVPVEQHAVLDGLIASTDDLSAGFNVKSQYTTLGVRWDVHPSAAFKVEYTMFNNKINSVYDTGLLKIAVVTVF